MFTDNKKQNATNKDKSLWDLYKFTQETYMPELCSISAFSLCEKPLILWKVFSSGSDVDICFLSKVSDMRMMLTGFENTIWLENTI